MSEKKLLKNNKHFNKILQHTQFKLQKNQR